MHILYIIIIILAAELHVGVKIVTEIPDRPIFVSGKI
jgi:hypothetical protein